MTQRTQARPAEQTSANSQASMQAIVQDRYATAPEQVLRLERIGIPRIMDDEILLRVRAAGVDRGTWHLMAGSPYVMRVLGFGLRGPKTRVPGLDVAGTVEAVGKKVAGVGIGDEVFGTAKGAFAEYAAAPASKVVPKPAKLTFEQAAAIAVSGTVALQAIRDHARVQPGQHVLVIGASGGVGSFAVQIAKAYDAEVTGVCSTAKVDFVRALGADHVIDYAREGLADGGRRYDAIIDIAGNRRLSELRGLLSRKGTLVITGGEGGPWLGGTQRNLWAYLLSPLVSQKLTAFVSRLNGDDLRVLVNLIEAGSLRPAIERIYPLADAPAALRSLAAGNARGKVVLTI